MGRIGSIRVGFAAGRSGDLIYREAGFIVVAGAEG